MKVPVLLLSILVSACSLPAADTLMLQRDGPGVRGIEARRDPHFSARYPATECLRIDAHGHGDAGIVCRSRSRELLINSGIGVQGGPDRVEDRGPITVSTGTSLYKMEEQDVDGGTLYTAEVDCDTHGGDLYRPTSTCSVTYWPLSTGEFIYANLTIEDHVSKRSILSRHEIDLIISRIEGRRPLPP